MAAVLRAVEASGLTTAEFARREGLSAGLLYTWRNRLSGRKATRRRPDPASECSESLSLIPVDVRLPEFAEGAEGRITVELCSGDKIHIPAGLPQEQVENLIGTLLRCC